jgi:hypothetical protein
MVLLGLLNSFIVTTFALCAIDVLGFKCKWWDNLYENMQAAALISLVVAAVLETLRGLGIK